eukprot:scaffold51466_cov34-Prasinocladus_malaysianus.AAC.2
MQHQSKWITFADNTATQNYSMHNLMQNVPRAPQWNEEKRNGISVMKWNGMELSRTEQNRTGWNAIKQNERA